MRKGNINNLQLLKDTDNSKVQAERGRKGGLAKSPAKVLASMKHKKCKNCNLACPVKAEGIEKQWRCKIPDAKRLILEAASDKSKLMDSIMGTALELELLAKNFTQKEKLYNAKLNLKKELYPNVQEHKIDARVGILSFEDIEIEAKRVLKA